MLIDILTENVLKNGVLRDEDEVLQSAYKEDKVLIFSEITNELGNLQKQEILVINAHGQNGRVSGMDAKTFATQLKEKGFKGCKEIHVYACQTGLEIDNWFAAELSKELGGVPVWAPKGNCVYNTAKGEYGIHEVAWSSEKNEWQKTGKVHEADKGWTLSADGKLVGTGVPTAPNPEGFAVKKFDWDAVDYSQFIDSIEVVEETENKNAT